MKIAVDKEARKALLAMPANRRRILMEKIRQLADDRAALANNIRRLRGRDGYRLRVGGDRVIFRDEGDTVVILAVAPRGGVYR